MPRRLLILASVLVIPPLLVLLFILIFKPRDDLRPLRPYIRSEYVRYYDIKGQPGLLWRYREITLYGMPRRTAFDNASKVVEQIYSHKKGWKYDPSARMWMKPSGGMADIFGRLDVNRWQGREVKKIPDDQLVPDTDPFYFLESGIPIDDWREKVWAKATGSIDHISASDAP